jgi:hypothetical protein
MEKFLGYEPCSSSVIYQYVMILVSPVIIGVAIIALAIIAGIVGLDTATKKYQLGRSCLAINK